MCVRIISTIQVQSGKWTGPTRHETLRLHEVLGVMRHDLGLKISYKAGQKDKVKVKKIVNHEQ